MWLDTLIVDQPTQHASGAVAGVGRKASRVETEPLSGPLNHSLGGRDLGLADLGLSLGMSITAEGVETQEQLARIRGEQCTHVQGYFTGRPMSADGIANFLSA